MGRRIGAQRHGGRAWAAISIVVLPARAADGPGDCGADPRSLSGVQPMVRSLLRAVAGATLALAAGCDRPAPATPEAVPDDEVATTTAPVLDGHDHTHTVAHSGSPADAQSFGIWQPGRFDTCTKAQHDAYSAIGPDGKRYPTWHPPTGPGGCTFGHEHGADPGTSVLTPTVGPVLFGYANERLFEMDPARARHEDHVGHKIEVLNGMRMRRVVNVIGPEFADAGITCDLLMHMHQGTHGPDAFANNAHEVHWYQRCSDGVEVRWNYLAPIGNPGQILRQCTRDFVRTGTPSPANQPQGNGNARALPSSTCTSRLMVPVGRTSEMSLLKEDWAGIHFFVGPVGVLVIDPYFDVLNPARVHVSGTRLQRVVDLCRVRGRTMVRSAECDRVRADTTITWDSPRSPFTGATRQLVVNSLTIQNRGGPTAWYTNAYGTRLEYAPFPGSIRQYVSSTSIDHSRIVGPAAVFRNWGGPGTGVHAPN
jgi:hypothetical protein